MGCKISIKPSSANSLFEPGDPFRKLRTDQSIKSSQPQLTNFPTMGTANVIEELSQSKSNYLMNLFTNQTAFFTRGASSFVYV